MSTYVPIQAITLSSATASVQFTGIPQNYTDLVLILNGGLTTTGQSFRFQFNGDTSSLYSYTWMAGNGSSASTNRVSNGTGINAYHVSGQSDTAIKNNVILQLQNYSNTTTNKTCILRGNTDLETAATAGLYRSTSAISSITVLATNGNLQSGSTFTLYGIGSGSPKAFGGDEVRTDGTFWYHIFRSSGRFEPVQALNNVEYLVIAGGGGGGSYDASGGGGAGGYRNSTVGELSGANSAAESRLDLLANTTYTVTVGAGGAGGGSGTPIRGTTGSNSVFGSITSNGGGGGGSNASGLGNGFNGGSGGGGAYNSTAASTGTANQGFAGGVGILSGSPAAGGGGGGGAGQAGASATVNGNGGKGGDGLSSVISGTSVTRAGGGGGGGDGSRGAGGAGGGGAGGNTNNGTANTGGGGGGGGVGSSTASGAGGSGIVIIRYAV